jgi:plasmid segregation protein ParM
MNTGQILKMIPNNVLKSFMKVDKVPNVEKEIVIEALDIGYGFTKYTKGICADGNIVCERFPSAVAVSPNEEMGGNFFIKRDTTTVNVGGLNWEVGPDINDIRSSNDSRALHDNFVKSEQWKALFLGALSYMEKPVIDFLILGLPVGNMSQAEEVEKLATGEHTVGDKTVIIKKALVIPQPLGALYNYAITSGQFEKFANTNTLVLDPGYRTFDFLTTKGFSVNPLRTGSRPGGMHAILDSIAKGISKEEGIEYDDLDQIDTSLNIANYKPDDGERMVFAYGKEIPLLPHIKNTVPVIEGSMNYMLTTISSSKDIAQIVMSGGPNKIFDKAVKKQFPHHQAKTLDDGIFSNVKGFMLWGLMTAYALASKEAVTK